MPVAIVTRATAKQKKDEIRLANLSNLFAQKRAALLVIYLVENKNINIVVYVLHYVYIFEVSRLEKMELSDANKYAILGDELRLRREIEFGHHIDERDTTSGRTILADAVAAGDNEAQSFICLFVCLMYASEFSAQYVVCSFLIRV